VLDKAEVTRLRKKRELELLLSGAIKQFIWHMLIIICLALVTFSNKDPQTFRVNELLKGTFFGGEHLTGVGFLCFIDLPFKVYINDFIL